LPRRFSLALYRGWARAVAALLRATVGLGYRARGPMPAGAVIYAAQHRSAWDSLLPALLLRDAAVVVKVELVRIPVYGWYLRRIGVIAIDREGGPAALRRLVREGR